MIVITRQRQQAHHHPSKKNYAEREWRDKQKAVDGLKDTVDKQRRDLDSMRKEVMEKEMLCSALRVSSLCYLLHTLSVMTHLIFSMIYLYVFL